MWKIKHIFDGDFGCEEGTFDEPTDVRGGILVAGVV